jgi:aminoglycoside 6-adenylyltransferase
VEDDILQRLIGWGEARPSIRAMILTSTRARPDGAIDRLSDYDVILAVNDVAEFATDDAWMHDFARPAASWGDEHDVEGQRTFFRGVVYADGTKIDYMIWPDSLLERITTLERLPPNLDVGYRVILDKDHRASGWATPAYQAHIPPRPTGTEYRALVEEFWWSSTYVAKALWRNELYFAKFVLDGDLRDGPLRRMLEWRIELDHDWALPPGAYGRGLERYLPADIWTELAATYVGVDVRDNWTALFRMAGVFRRVASEVGDALGYPYPREVDETIEAHLETVRRMPPRE